MGSREARIEHFKVLINAVTGKVGSSTHSPANPMIKLLRPSLLPRQRPDTINIQLPFGTPACQPCWNRRSKFLIEAKCVLRKLFRSEGFRKITYCHACLVK
jgi:hypothetical protein